MAHTRQRCDRVPPLVIDSIMGDNHYEGRPGWNWMRSLEVEEDSLFIISFELCEWLRPPLQSVSNQWPFIIVLIDGQFVWTKPSGNNVTNISWDSLENHLNKYKYMPRE